MPGSGKEVHCGWRLPQRILKKHKEMQAGNDLDTQSWGEPGYTHAASSIPTAAAARVNLESATERGGFCLHVVRWRQDVGSQDRERLLDFWKGGV